MLHAFFALEAEHVPAATKAISGALLLHCVRVCGLSLSLSLCLSVLPASSCNPSIELTTASVPETYPPPPASDVVGHSVPVAVPTPALSADTRAACKKRFLSFVSDLCSAAPFGGILFCYTRAQLALCRLHHNRPCACFAAALCAMTLIPHACLHGCVSACLSACVLVPLSHSRACVWQARAVGRDTTLTVFAALK